jgi:hypothetical protein
MEFCLDFDDNHIKYGEDLAILQVGPVIDRNDIEHRQKNLESHCTIFSSVFKAFQVQSNDISFNLDHLRRDQKPSLSSRASQAS